MKKTKIVCTLGPCSRKPAVIKDMIKAGMDLARLNLYWSDPEEHAKRIKIIREMSKENNTKVLIIEDDPTMLRG